MDVQKRRPVPLAVPSGIPRIVVAVSSVTEIGRTLSFAFGMLREIL